jgi:hypothetical protein
MSVLKVSDTCQIDAILSAAGDVWWVNSGDIAATVGGQTIPPKGFAQMTDLQGAALEVLILPEGGCLLINRGDAAVTAGGTELAAGASQTLEAYDETMATSVPALVVDLAGAEVRLSEAQPGAQTDDTQPTEGGDGE